MSMRRQLRGVVRILVMLHAGTSRRSLQIQARATRKRSGELSTRLKRVNI